MVDSPPHKREKVLWNKNIDSGFPHSTDVDNPEWNRNSSPILPRFRKTTIKQLRLEWDGRSITINNIVVVSKGKLVKYINQLAQDGETRVWVNY